MSRQNKFSANELAKELTRLNKELIPLQNEIASSLEKRDKIPEYKKDIMASMMKTYCDLRNKVIDTKNNLDLVMTLKDTNTIKMDMTDSDDSPFNFSSDDNEKEEDEEKKEEKEKEEEK
ncbi:hypothetical protein M9Y10_022207 [Tritrichomonas musculus]|uniref:Uncharacterized protein n=1 Tax=Tritrichomonas musculus TaxID=1915356 RepID=A0ABR2KSH1_9EUKA